MSDKKHTFGPFTFQPWNKCFSATLVSGNDYDKHSRLRFSAFRRALEVRLPMILKPLRQEHRRSYGISLSDMGNGYDFLQVFYGPQTFDSLTTKSWSKHLPWKMWNHVRHSAYNPDGTHFYTNSKSVGWSENHEQMEKCPTVRFEFEDHDGKNIVATCHIEEREWHKGSGCFKWLKYFSKPKIARSLSLGFDSEVGPEKGSYKGGTIGHSTDIEAGETPEQAFRRYCEQPHRARGNKFYFIKFLRTL